MDDTKALNKWLASREPRWALKRCLREAQARCRQELKELKPRAILTGEVVAAQDVKFPTWK